MRRGGGEAAGVLPVPRLAAVVLPQLGGGVQLGLAQVVHDPSADRVAQHVDGSAESNKYSNIIEYYIR